MKVRCKVSDQFDLTKGKVYEVIEVDKKFNMYRIIDDSGEDYLYETEYFDLVGV